MIRFRSLSTLVSLQYFTLLSFLSIFPFLGVTLSAQIFSEQAVNAGLVKQVVSTSYMGGGLAWFDFDGDGWEDVYVTGGEAGDALFRNQGNGTFVEVTVGAGLSMTGTVFTTGVVTGDIDRDGDRDIFVTTREPDPNFLFRNNGDGTFTDIASTAGLTHSSWSESAAMADFNLDGYLDIYVVNYLFNWVYVLDSVSQQPIGYDHDCFENWCYLNNGDGTFREISLSAGLDNGNGCGLVTTLSDYDNDADTDILVGNDFGGWIVPNTLYRNDNPVTESFSDQSQAAGFDLPLFCMGIATADYDHDLDLDYYFTNLGRNALLHNLGNGSFRDTTDFCGITDSVQRPGLLSSGWGTAFVDFNNDTWQDLYVANGFVPAEDFVLPDTFQYDRLYSNQGNCFFAEVAVSNGTDDPAIGRGMAVADYDHDGNMDLIVVVINDSGISFNENIRLYRNVYSGTNNYLQISLRGILSNPDGFGAHIEMYTAGQSWLYEVQGGSSFGSQNSSVAHFGLGNEQQADSVRIIWPGGRMQVLRNVAANQRMLVVEDTAATAVREAISEAPRLELSPSPFSDKLQIRYFLPQKTHTQLSIYSMQGKLIMESELEALTPGWKTFTWRPEASEQISTGVYLIQLQSSEHSISRKVIYYD